MDISLQCPGGRMLRLSPGGRLYVGTDESCDLRLTGMDQAGRIAGLVSDGIEAWMHVFVREPLVCVNGRPIQRMVRLSPGDRVCFGSCCVDLLGRGPDDDDRPNLSTGFALRIRGGAGSGGLHHGPTLHLDANGEVVSAAAGVVGLILAESAVHLDPGTALVRVNGHSIDSEVRVRDGDQLQIGGRRFTVEEQRFRPVPVTTGFDQHDSGSDEAVFPGAVDLAGQAQTEPSGLWWLVGISALLAAGLAALFYFR